MKRRRIRHPEKRNRQGQKKPKTISGRFLQKFPVKKGLNWCFVRKGVIATIMAPLWVYDKNGRGDYALYV